MIPKQADPYREPSETTEKGPAKRPERIYEVIEKSESKWGMNVELKLHPFQNVRVVVDDRFAFDELCIGDNVHLQLVRLPRAEESS